MVVANTMFGKRPSRLVTYESGSSRSQISYLLVWRAVRKLVKDVKVIAREECVSQHRLVMCDLTLKTIIEINSRPYALRRKVLYRSSRKKRLGRPLGTCSGDS